MLFHVILDILSKFRDFINIVINHFFEALIDYLYNFIKFYFLKSSA